MHERIRKFEEILEKDLKEELDKINSAGKVSLDSMKTVECAIELMLKINEYKGWLMSGENENSYDEGYSSRRGRSMTTGRYVSRDYAPGRSYDHMREPYSRSYDQYDMRYSGHSVEDRLINDLEKMYDSAQSDYERQVYKKWIDRMEMDK